MYSKEYRKINLNSYYIFFKFKLMYSQNRWTYYCVLTKMFILILCHLFGRFTTSLIYVTLCIHIGSPNKFEIHKIICPKWLRTIQFILKRFRRLAHIIPFISNSKHTFIRIPQCDFVKSSFKLSAAVRTFHKFKISRSKRLFYLKMTDVCLFGGATRLSGQTFSVSVIFPRHVFSVFDT